MKTSAGEITAELRRIKFSRTFQVKKQRQLSEEITDLEGRISMAKRLKTSPRDLLRFMRRQNVAKAELAEAQREASRLWRRIEIMEQQAEELGIAVPKHSQNAVGREDRNTVIAEQKIPPDVVLEAAAEVLGVKVADLLDPGTEYQQSRDVAMYSVELMLGDGVDDRLGIVARIFGTTRAKVNSAGRPGKVNSAENINRDSKLVIARAREMLKANASH